PVGVVKAKKDLILTKTAQYNAQRNAAPLSISVGLSVTDDLEDGTIYDLYHRSVVDLEEERLALNMSPGQKVLYILMENLEEKGFIYQDPEDPLWKATQKVLSGATLPDNEVKNLQLMVRAHNMGYIVVPDKIREKPDKLTPGEFEQIKQHPQIGCNIAIQSVEYAPVATQILHHHERWDGNGYPAGLKGKRIPRECRIFSVLDAYGAMVSKRPFRRAKSPQNALNEIIEESGTQFDPDVAEEVVNILK
ncbi:HD-GYP domain-containing protein, partial [Planctomycetota bacterium]